MIDIKNKLKKIYEDCSERKEEVSQLIGETVGLISAYELANNHEILELAINNLVEILKHFVEKKDFSTYKAINNEKNINGELSDFYSYLVNGGKTPVTSNAYRKAVERVMKNNNVPHIIDLNERIDELIHIYDGNDSQYHNTHVAALRQYKKYINNKGE